MKKSQNGSATTVILASISAIIVLIPILVFFWSMSVKNSFVGLQEEIVAADKQRKTRLSQYTLTIIEMAKVPKNQVEMIKATVEEQIRLREGEGGNKSMFRIFKEHNITVNSVLLENIQKKVNGGREDYTNDENHLTEVIRTACTTQQRSPDDIALRFWGYPTLHYGCNGDPINNYPTIMSESSKDTFGSGVDKGVNF